LPKRRKEVKDPRKEEKRMERNQPKVTNQLRMILKLQPKNLSLNLLKEERERTVIDQLHKYCKAVKSVNSFTSVK